MLNFAMGMLLAAGTPASGHAQLADKVAPETLTEFARPHELVDIGGDRKLNLFCMGTGKHTVLLDAGGSDWSVIWGLVQPLVAKHARACSYDRAGLGYSDPAIEPRTPVAIVEDLHALVHAAKLRTPLVLVGHSLGGFNMKLYAALYPEDVAGMVLVDPSEDRMAERTRAQLRKRFGDSLAARLELTDSVWMKLLIARYAACAAQARAGDFDSKSIAYKRCSDPVRPALGPEVAEERARIQVHKAYQEAQASELANSVYGDAGGDAAYRMLFGGQRYGAKPLIVLTHGIFDPADPLDAASYQAYLWLHSETAALSSRGCRRTVPNTSHNIEIDSPSAVAVAIGEVLDQLDKVRGTGRALCQD